MSCVYILDDDLSIVQTLSSILTKEGYQVIGSTDPCRFLDELESCNPAVIIIDIFYGPDLPTGDYLISVACKTLSNVQCIVISGESDIQKTLACLRNGAIDFIEKPISLPRLITTVKNAFRVYNVKATNQERFRIIGKSNTVKSLYERIRKVASLNESVLISGENGAGKELVAQNIYLYSQRYAFPMVTINCTSLNNNLIESELFGHVAGSFSGAQKDKKVFFSAAHGSSLFIDEIGDFDLALQSKLLRVIQEKKIIKVGTTLTEDIDVRLIFATHCNLETMISEKIFREDLFYRISTFTIAIPPLRERLEDIDDLAKYFLDIFLVENKLPQKEFSVNALEKLKAYSYPGNVRELAKIVKNAAIFSDTEVICAEDVYFQSVNNQEDIWNRTKKMTLLQGKEYFEREFVTRRLNSFNFDIPKTAESFGVIRTNLYRKMNELGIENKKFVK